MLRIATMALIGLSLSGCMSPEQIIARDDATCRSWGTSPGSQNYVECRAMLSQHQAMEDMQRRNNAAMAAGILLSR